MCKTTSLYAIALSLLALPVIALAGDDDKSKATPPPVTTPPTPFITGDAGTSFITQYISRGLVLNNQDAINQSNADLYLQLYANDSSVVSKVILDLSIWADFDPHKTQAGTAEGGTLKNVTLPWWYEFDFLPGFTFTIAKYFTFNPSLYIFTSPSSAFTTFMGANLNLAFDDSTWLGKFALHPSVTFLRELHNKAGDGRTQGDYYELDINPGLPVGPATLSFPVTLGLGSNQFYGNNSGFGYVEPGVSVAVPLKFIPAAYGPWTLTTTYRFYYLSNDLANFNTGPGPESVRRASHYANVFSGGLSVTF